MGAWEWRRESRKKGTEDEGRGENLKHYFNIL